MTAPSRPRPTVATPALTRLLAEHRQRARLPKLAGVALILAACGGDGPVRDAGTSTLTIHDPTDERIFSPVWGAAAMYLLFEPLAATGATGEPEPRLAKRWEHSEDFRTWTYHLRTDVRWHDGTPVTARDIEFTFRLLAHPEVVQYVFDSLQLHDDSTISITYRNPSDRPETWLTFFPRHLLEHEDPARLASWEFWSEPVGNGPYRWLRSVPKTMVELEANPDYYRGKAEIEQVVVRFGGNPITELLSGNVDVLTSVSRAEVPKLALDPRFRVYHGIGTTWLEAIFWNHRLSLFADARVRRALTMAIDRRELHRIQNLPHDLPLFDVPFTPRQLLRGELPAPLPYDAEGAALLLTESGWTDVDEDGVLEKGGREFRFTAVVSSDGGASTFAFGNAATYVQERLARIGVRMEILPQPGGGLTVLRERLLDGDFEAIFIRIHNSPREGYLAFGDSSYLGYQNPRVARLFERARTTYMHEQRDSIYAQLMPLLQADLPITYLGPQVKLFAAHRRVQGLSSPWRADPLGNLPDLWLEEQP